MFSKENGALVIKRVDMPRIPMNVMQDQQDSYRQYITSTVYEDMKYLEELLKELKGLENVTLQVHVKELVSQTFARTQVNKGRFYYPVVGTFYLNGHPVGSDLELLRIPYMDDYCKINVAGASKVVLITQRPSEDISYTLKDNMFNIAMPYANIRIYATKSAIKIAFGKYKIPADMVLTAMLYECGDERTLYDIFQNTFLLNTFKVNPKSLSNYIYDSVVKQWDILSRYKSMQYELGDTRLALNEALTLNRAVGFRLSRKVLDYEPDTLITEDMIPVLKRNRVNEVYVKSDKIPDGYLYGDEVPIIIQEIPAGVRNCAYLRMELPKYAHVEKFTERVELFQEEFIIIAQGAPITSAMAEFLLQLGYTELIVTAGTSKTKLRYSFEREIIGNYTAHLKELTDTIPDGRYADEWVYYYDNPSLERVDDSHLTAHDLAAILSVMGQIMVTGETPLLNRDTSFLKKVMLINETFSENLRTAMTGYVRKYASVIPSRIVSPTSDNVFFGLTKAWIKEMNAGRVLAPADTVNLSAEVSQVCHVTTVLNNPRAVDDMHQIAMPYYGRICPFETPAGQKIGLVNTKALGTRVEKGLLKVPYRKVIKTSNGIRISNTVTYMSVKEELGHKFGDILTLEKDENGNYKNTPVLARIPNPVVCDEPFIFANIKAFDLAGEYVEAYPEQYLSPTVALVPFAGSDDAVRLSYGASQMRQAIYLLHSQKPIVSTFMNYDIFNYSDKNSFISPCAGIVKQISNQEAIIVDDATGENRIVPMQGARVTGQLDMTIDILAKPGQHVSEGELIADGYKYPQSFVVRAPFSGTIRNIRDNAIEIEKSDRLSEFVNLDACDMIAFDNGRVIGQSAVFMNIEVCVGDFVEKGQILATTSMSRDGCFSPSRNELTVYAFMGFNYEDGILASQEASMDYISLIAHSVDKTISKKHFPHAAVNPIQGFKYCGEGDVIGSISTQEDVSSGRSYTTNVYAKGKCSGIPFEHTTLEDDATHRKYRFHMLGLNPLRVGDKMSGRHGNKGTVSFIYPNSWMPQLMNGLQVNLAISPAGSPSRMNIGMIWEMHLSLIGKVLCLSINSDPYNGATEHDVEMLMNYTYDLANTESVGPIGGPYNRAEFERVCRIYPEVPSWVNEHSWEHMDEITDWRGVFNRQGDAIIYDPVTETFLDYPLTIGYMLYQKQMQESDEKITYRSGPLEEQYGRTTSQPQKGDGSDNGQRVAEMEFMALAAYGAANIIDEVNNEKSDNIGARVNAHLKQLNINYQVPKEGCTSRAVENLIYMLEAMGVHLEVPRDVAATDYDDLKYKYTFNLKKLIQKHYMLHDNQTYKLKSMSMESDYASIADFFEGFGVQ